MRLLSAVLLLIPAVPFATAGSAARPFSGFLERGDGKGFWTLGDSYRAVFDAAGFRLHRGGRQVLVTFPGASLQWQQHGRNVSTLQFAAPEVGLLQGADTLLAKDIYPGVHLQIRQHEGVLKSEFQLKAGIAAAPIRYCFTGATVKEGPNGSLHLDAGGGWEWSERGLISWQVSADGKRVPVESRFRVEKDCVSVETDTLNPELPLVIDPEITFSSFLGGGLFDAITAVQNDAAGNTYVGGWTESSDFPTVSGYRGTSAGGVDAFIAKIDPDGRLVYATYLGGTGEDRVQGLSLEKTGKVCASGFTTSANFPTIPASRVPGGLKDAFALCLHADGLSLAFSTTLGGSGNDMASAVAVDADGSVVIAGETNSSNFPVLSAFSAGSGGGVDGFVARIAVNGTLVSSTFLGGNGDDRIRGVALGPDRVIHLTGSTTSSNLPLAAAVQQSRQGAMDAFYARMDAAGRNLLLSTYWGGAGGASLSEEAGYAVAVDATGRIWTAGVTPSRDFPGTMEGFQSVYGGGDSDAFVTVWEPSGRVGWGSYLGGSGQDAATGLSAGGGVVSLSGYTTSSNFPVRSALQSARGGDYDAFWAAFAVSGTRTPLHVSYLGGASADSGLATSSNAGFVSIAGQTLSSNFPVANPVQAGNGGGFGGFLTRMRFGPAAATLLPAAGSGASQIFTLTVPNGDGGTAAAYLLFNAALSTVNGCYLAYRRDSGSIALYRDSDASWLTLPQGAGGNVENTACRLDGGVGVSISASQITLTLPLTFKASLAGSLKSFTRATDLQGVDSPWASAGTWSNPAVLAPYAEGFSPNYGGGRTQTFTITLVAAAAGSVIDGAVFILNQALNGNNGCYLSYSRPADRFYVYRDSDGTWQSTSPGSATAASGNNCVLAGAGLSAITSGAKLTLTLPLSFQGSFSGVKTFYVQARDSGGRTSAFSVAGQWDPGVGLVPPSLKSITPPSGSGLAQTFTVSVADDNGSADLRGVVFLINGALNGNNGCYISYSRVGNRFSLYRDAEANWAEIFPGSASSVSNANCTLSGTGLNAVAGGNSITFFLPLRFAPEFGTAKSFFVLADDMGGLSSGWTKGGTWNPLGPPVAPTVGGMSPASGSGKTQTFALRLLDGNGPADISGALFLINRTLDGNNGCFISFNKSTNSFALLRDSDKSWLSLSPGTAVSVANTNCTLAGAGLSAVVDAAGITISLPLTFSDGFAGSKQAYANVVDLGGLSSDWVQVGSWTNPGRSVPPVVSSVTPTSGRGASQIFNVSVFDSNGASDITEVAFLMNSIPDGNNACFISYDRVADTFALFRDSDGVWLTIKPGSPGAVSNRNCTLSGLGLSSSVSGNLVVVGLPLTFSTAFAGTRIIYTTAWDAAGLTSGWSTMGTWVANP